MKKWESWSPCQEFPNLRELSLVRCPKLSGKLPDRLPLLNKVEINDCGQLVVFVSSFPDQCKIVIDKVSEGVLCGSKVTFKSIRFDSVQTISELTSCRIEGFDVEGLAKVEYLDIRNCDKLVSLVAEDEEEEGLQLGMPSTLKTIWIEKCKALESLPKAMMYYSTWLAFIRIYECDSLKHFARGQLPPTLKRLEIRGCKNMRKLVVEDDDDDDTINSCSSIPSLLEELDIKVCPSLESLISNGELPATLRELSIVNCPNLESVAKNFLHNSSLESITISECENLKFLNERDLLPPNLRQLSILHCQKMKPLPRGIQNLTSLQSLAIRNCPSIQPFPVEGFPANITTLGISHQEIPDALFIWAQNNLTFLKQLHIGGCYNLVSFPEMTLPTSLTSLRISDLSNLESLSSKGLRKLDRLETLQIYNCEKLTCFSVDGLPPSLLELHISNCPRLRSFPKNGLPPSLQKLEIRQCPLLEECCKKDQREEGSRIADIPYVEITGGDTSMTAAEE